MRQIEVLAPAGSFESDESSLSRREQMQCIWEVPMFGARAYADNADDGTDAFCH